MGKGTFFLIGIEFGLALNNGSYMYVYLYVFNFSKNVIILKIFSKVNEIIKRTRFS